MKDSKKIGLRIASLTLCLAIACGGSIAVVRASGENTESGSTSASSEKRFTSWPGPMAPPRRSSSAIG